MSFLENGPIITGLIFVVIYLFLMREKIFKSKLNVTPLILAFLFGSMFFSGLIFLYIGLSGKLLMGQTLSDIRIPISLAGIGFVYFGSHNFIKSLKRKARR